MIQAAPLWLDEGWLVPAIRRASPNFGERPSGTVISLIVLHNISLPPAEFGGPWIEDFFLNRLDGTVHPYFAEIAGLEVSAHFFIRRDGQIMQFVACDKRAWHAGRSCWGDQENCNDFSIGIELEGCDEKPFETAQYASLWPLLDALRDRYPISAVAGHSHIAPGRKTDPGPFFDWPALASRYPELALPPEVAA